MVFRGDIMVILTLISVSISSLCLIYFLSMVCIQLNYILNINLSMGMDVVERCLVQLHILIAKEGSGEVFVGKILLQFTKNREVQSSLLK